MSDKKNGKKTSSAGGTLWRWLKRAFFGASKELTDDDVFAVEKLESPSKLAVKAFFRRKLAVVALVVLISMFLLVFIGPLFLPMDLNFTDSNQANIAPTMSMKSVPAGLKDNISSIHGYANFTVGVSRDNNLYIWGYTKDALTKADYSVFPEDIKEGNVLVAASGRDHAIAVTKDGRVIGWGENSRGQYGKFTGNEDDPIIEMPEQFINGRIEDVSKVQDIVCGYQKLSFQIN